MRYTVWKTVRELLTHSDYDPVHITIKLSSVGAAVVMERSNYTGLTVIDLSNSLTAAGAYLMSFAVRVSAIRCAPPCQQATRQKIERLYFAPAFRSNSAISV
jgi:hypothetical protein